MASSREGERLDRLAGSEGRGGGLPLPLLFAAILNELLDQGSADDETMTRITSDTLDFKAQAVFATWRTWDALRSDVLEQMASRKVVTRGPDGRWALGPKFAAGKPLTIIPKHGSRPSDGVTVWESAERIARSKAAHAEAELQSMYSGLQREGAFPVTVIGARGGQERKMYRLHPLARAIPQIPEDEFLTMAKDVAAHGILMPLIVIGDQVLDGRHRLAIASALDLPVRVTEFGGTEKDARAHVISLNVQRRHLTVPQRGLIVLELLMPEAEAEAKERQQESEGRGVKKVAPDGATFPGEPGVSPGPGSGGKKATEIAAERSGGLANARTLERMKPVAQAPETRERIRSGEIKTATEARRAALKETGRDEPEDVGALVSRSAWHHLGLALGEVRNACDSLEEGNAGTMPPDKIAERISEIREHLDRAEKLNSEVQQDPA
jgi:hypothetical protein